MNQSQARELSIRLELPQLRGTVRDIKEAEIIRAQRLQIVPFFEEEWEIFMTNLSNRNLPESSLWHLKSSDQANFWIENSDLDFWDLLAWFD